MLNLCALLKNRELHPYILSWIQGFLARRFPFIKKPSAPFEQQKISNDEIIYNLIISALKNKTPLMMGRYGATEHDFMRMFLLYKSGITDLLFNREWDKLCNNAGFFIDQSENKKKAAEKFYEIMVQATSNCDVFGTWNGWHDFEKYFIQNFCNTIPMIVGYSFFGPNIDAEIPFSYALKDTTVLIVHPFAQSIQSQYKNYDKLFINKKVLPRFHLKTFQAIQTAGGEIDKRFGSWFEALDWMSNEISKIDFDIALIACGAYGFPLASKIKDMGKIAIHCGGTLQLLFGIKGRRWEKEQPSVGQSLFNEYWVYPNQNERIKNTSRIEDGCYW